MHHFLLTTPRQGTVFDVSEKDAYGPSGQYKGGFLSPSFFFFFAGVGKGEKEWCNRDPGTNIPDSPSVFAGKEPNRALAQSSLKPEDCRPEWEDLADKEKTVLDEWYTFFSKRYNIVGKVQREGGNSATL